jgi:hypothetical protein
MRSVRDREGEAILYRSVRNLTYQIGVSLASSYQPNWWDTHKRDRSIKFNMHQMQTQLQVTELVPADSLVGCGRVHPMVGGCKPRHVPLIPPRATINGVVPILPPLIL